MKARKPLLHRIQFFAFLIFALTALQACAQDLGGLLFDDFRKDLDCAIIAPPEKFLPAGVDKIAVFDFEGSYGNTVAAAVISSMTDSEFGRQKKSYQQGARTNVYTLVEREEIEKLIEEQKMSDMGLVSEESAVEIGQLLGADAMIFGTVKFSATEEQREERDRVRVNKKTKVKVPYKEYRWTRTIVGTTDMRIVSTESSEVLGTSSVQGQGTSTSEWSESRNEKSGLKSANQLKQMAAKSCGQRLAAKFMPHFENMSFKIENIKIKGNRTITNRAKEAKDKINQGEFQEGFTTYKAISEVDPYNAAAYYNLGTLFEAVGNYERASEKYGKAYQLESSNSLYLAAKQRAERGKEMLQIMEERFGVVIEAGEYDETSGLKEAIRKQIEIKGSRSKRSEVRLNPDSGSKVITKVPGKTRFKVLKKQGDWYRIQLIDGSEGYVHKSDAREI